MFFLIDLDLKGQAFGPGLLRGWADLVVQDCYFAIEEPVDLYFVAGEPFLDDFDLEVGECFHAIRAYLIGDWYPHGRPTRSRMR